MKGLQVLVKNANVKSIFVCYTLTLYLHNFQEIPGLTDGNVPRRLGPKRASKIRKLFNLTKEDDVRRYVVKRLLPAKEGKENAKPRYKVNQQQNLELGWINNMSKDCEIRT